jgi:hypothetical protein
MQAAFHGISRQRFWWLALGVTLLLPLVLTSGTLATEVLVYAMAVMACNVLLGYTGLLSFGQGIFFGRVSASRNSRCRCRWRLFWPWWWARSWRRWSAGSPSASAARTSSC